MMKWIVLALAAAQGNTCPGVWSGCSVSCEPGMKPVCTPPNDGYASWCHRDASCECESR
jgi:hypothetical protein